MNELENIIANLVQKIEHHFYGKYRGFVVDNNDPEQLGRLKLKVPTLFGDKVVTGWALPCFPYGGDFNQGFLYIPENGAGVWVEFEGGDLEFPVWVGTFWSKPKGKSELPKPNSEDGKEQAEVQKPPTCKIIKTKKGHTIQIEDKDKEEMIAIIQPIDEKKRNVFTMTLEGITITQEIDEKKRNVMEMREDSVTLTQQSDQDTKKNTVEMKPDLMTLTQKSDAQNDNQLEMKKEGMTLTQQSSGKKNIINMKKDTITTTDSTGNIIEMSNKNIKITSKVDFQLDAAGKSIKLSGKSVAIEATADAQFKGKGVKIIGSTIDLNKG